MAFADGEDSVYYKFDQSDSTYSFYGSFQIEADSICLLELNFRFEHIKTLAVAAQKVTLIGEDTNWNKISYTYRKFIFFENISVWHRDISRKKQRVDFTMLSSINNNSFMPQLISSSGYYQIFRQGEKIRVEYYHECNLSKTTITNLYINAAKKEGVEFITLLWEYAREHCK